MISRPFSLLRGRASHAVGNLILIFHGTVIKIAGMKNNVMMAKKNRYVLPGYLVSPTKKMTRLMKTRGEKKSEKLISYLVALLMKLIIIHITCFTVGFRGIE